MLKIAEKIFSKISLFYLGLLPSLATFFVLRDYEVGMPTVVAFILGTVVVGIYLVSTNLYTSLRLKDSLTVLLYPVGTLLLVALYQQDLDFYGLVIETYFLESTALIFCILSLAVVSDKPTPQQRWLSIGLMAAVLLFQVFFFWDYLLAEIDGDPLNALFYVFLVVSNAWLGMKVIEKDERINEDNPIFTALFVFVWAIVLFIGYSL